MNQSRMPAPAILVAVLALVAALAGTAVAGPDASTSAITKKTVKKLIKKEVAKQIANATGPQGPQGAEGPQGPTGLAGQDAVSMFAFVADGGPAAPAQVQYGSGATAVDDPNATDGTYDLTFNQSVAGCVAFANTGVGDPVAGSVVVDQQSFANISMNAGGPNVMRVEMIQADTPARTETSFLVGVFC